MTFDNDRFTDVISYLEDKYQLQIICPEEIADTLYLTLVVRDETKEEIFKEIARISRSISISRKAPIVKLYNTAYETP